MSLTLWNNCQKIASVLDEIAPGWYRNVDLDELDMSCGLRNCMMGQLSPNTSLSYKGQFVTEIEGLDEQVKGSDVFAVYHVSDEEHCQKLDKYWTTLVRQRQENPEHYESSNSPDNEPA